MSILQDKKNKKNDVYNAIRIVLLSLLHNAYFYLKAKTGMMKGTDFRTSFLKKASKYTAFFNAFPKTYPNLP